MSSETAATPPLRCANLSTKCPNTATSCCSGCNLVKYCGIECQRAHWKTHKPVCKSPMSKENWDPEWFTSGRIPAFMTMNNNGPSLSAHGLGKYLWGNMPAFDHVKLAANEGSDWKKPLDLCFAASGDLRNIIVSINSLPPAYKSPCNIVVNDREIFVVLRNLLLFLTFSSFPPAEAAGIGVHLWYSARLPTLMLNKLREAFSSHLEDIVWRMRSGSMTPAAMAAPLSTTFTLSKTAKMHCILPRAYWAELLGMLAFPLGSDNATRARHLITMNEARRDYRERHLYMLPPGYRLSKQQYYAEGILLPFSADRSVFTEPNFTLFDPHSGGWLLNDSADPLVCWDLSSIIADGEKHKIPRNDLYGALYYHLLPQFESFSRRLHTENLTFTLFSVDAQELEKVLKGSVGKHNITSFDRIDVSNLTDLAWIGLNSALSLGRLLKPKQQNPHAVLITLFLNYDADMELNSPTPSGAANQRGIMEAMSLLSMRIPRGPMDPFAMRLMGMGEYLKDFARSWERYRRDLDFVGVARRSGMVQREKGRVVSALPYELKRGGGKERMKEHIRMLDVSGLHGHERYVEWIRA